MKDLLLDSDPDELERYLLDQGRRDRAGEGARRRTLARVTVAAAAGAVVTTTSVSSGAAAGGALGGATGGALGGAASGATSAVPWLLTAKWVGVGLASGAVALGVAEGAKHRDSPKAHEPVAMVVAAPTAELARQRSHAVEPHAPIDTASDSREGAGAPSGEGVVAARRTEPLRTAAEARSVQTPIATKTPIAATTPTAVTAPPRPASAPSNGQGSLERELGRLDQARSALDTGVPAQALTALDRYAAEFPAGGMRIEASALRIETLLALGRRQAAENLATTFLASYPRSPAAMRVQRLIDAQRNAER